MIMGVLIKVKYYFIFQIMDIILLLDVYEWRPPSLSELTPIVFDMELTHLSWEAFKCISSISF